MKLLATFFIFISFFLNQNISDLRKEYVNAAKSKQAAENFYNLVLKQDKNKSVISAYFGAATALKSRYETKREYKKQLFVEGVTIVEKAVKADSNNLEIRLIRLSIQENTPKILKYKSNITEDKNMIISNYSKQTKDLKAYIKDYVDQSKTFSDVEKKTFN